MQAALSQVVDGLFSALTSLGVVPVIRCPQVKLPVHLQCMEYIKARTTLMEQ